MPVATNYRRTSLAIGCSAHAIQDGLTAATYVLLPVLSQTFGFTYTQVGLFKGLKSLTQAALEMYSGFLSERIGNGTTLIVGLILAGIGYAALAGAPDATFVLICLIVVGAGSAFQHAPASALVSAAYAQRGRRGALGLYNSAGDVGKLAFSAGFSLAIAAGFAWQQVALSYGTLAFVAAIAIALVLWQRSPETVVGISIAKDQNEQQQRSAWGIQNHRQFLTLLIVIFLDNIVQAGILVFIAFLLIEKGLPLSLATLGAAAVLTGGVFGKAGCGFVAERIGVRKAFAVVQVLTAFGLILVVFAPAWLAFLLLFPLGVVAQGSTSITYGLIPDMVDASRVARGYALMYSSTTFASAAGPFIFGIVSDDFGVGVSMIAMAVISVAAVPPIMFFDEKAGSAGRST